MEQIFRIFLGMMKTFLFIFIISIIFEAMGLSFVGVLNKYESWLVFVSGTVLFTEWF